MAPLIALIVIMGVYPKPFIERIEPAVDKLVRHVEDNSDYVEPAVATKGDEIVPASERRGEEGGSGEHAEAGETVSSGHEGGE